MATSRSSTPEPLAACESQVLHAHQLCHCARVEAEELFSAANAHHSWAMGLLWLLSLSLVLATTVHSAFGVVAVALLIVAVALLAVRDGRRAAATRILGGLRETRQLPVARVIRSRSPAS